MEPRLRIGVVLGACAAASLCAGGARGQQIAKLTASDAEPEAFFGADVSISGATALVGASWGYGTVDDSGSAYIFTESGGTWEQFAKLAADDGAEADRFGGAVSLSGRTAIVGANRADANGADSGAAYIFRESGGAWEQIAKLVADSAGEGSGFGSTVSISGNTAVVGTDYYGTTHAAYLFEERDGTWEPVATLGSGDGFGSGVSIDGDMIVIGAPFDGDRGAAYVFTDVNGTWQQVARQLADDDTPWAFGRRVSINEDTAAISAYFDESGSTFGVVYIFQSQGGVWRQVAKLTADDVASGNAFGTVSISGNTVLIGASADDDRGRNGGAAYVFREIGGEWERVSKLYADDGAAYDYFGIGVAVSGSTALIGAWFDDDHGSQSGSAYVFDIGEHCHADFNNDGSVNTLDVLGFLNAWAAGDPSADFNGDGTVNTLDVLAFLNAWTAGC